MRSVKCTVVVGTKTLFFSDGDVTSALSVVLSNTPRESYELPATLRARGWDEGLGCVGAVRGCGGEQGEDVPGFTSGGDVVGWFYLGRGAAFDRLVSSPWVLNPL